MYKEKLYIFGGYNALLKEHFNDIHCYDPVASSWHLVKTFGKGPSKRRRQVCIVIEDKLYLFGGTRYICVLLTFYFSKVLCEKNIGCKYCNLQMICIMEVDTVRVFLNSFNLA